MHLHSMIFLFRLTRNYSPTCVCGGAAGGCFVVVVVVVVVVFVCLFFFFRKFTENVINFICECAVKSI